MNASLGACVVQSHVRRAHTPSCSTKKKYGVSDPFVIITLSCARTTFPEVTKEPLVKIDMSFRDRSTGTGRTADAGAGRGLLTSSALFAAGDDDAGGVFTAFGAVLCSLGSILWMVCAKNEQTK